MIAIATRVNTQSLPEDFERLYCEHSKFIYRTAYRITGNSEDAEDAMQTLFLRMLRRELPPDFDRNPKAYLYRAAVNIALNIVRARKSRSAFGYCRGQPGSPFRRGVSRRSGNP